MKKYSVYTMLYMLLVLSFAAPVLAVDGDPAFKVELSGIETPGVLNYHEVGVLTIGKFDNSSVIENVYLSLTSSSDKITFYEDVAATQPITESIMVTNDNLNDIDRTVIYVKSNISQDEVIEDVTVTVTDKDNGENTGETSFDLIGAYLDKVDVDIETDETGSILVNDRAKIVLTLLDQAGNTYKASKDTNISLRAQQSDYKAGKFFTKKFAGDNENRGQTEITDITIEEGEDSVTVYFQPIPNKSYEPNITLVFGYLGGITKEGSTTAVDVTVKPAGNSWVELCKEGPVEEGLWSPVVGTAFKLRINLYDQYGYAQPSDGKTPVILSWYKVEQDILDKHDELEGDLKFYADENLTIEITDGEFIIPEGETSSFVYITATQAGKYSFDAQLPGGDYDAMWDECIVEFFPDVVTSMKLWVEEDDAIIKPGLENAVEVKINAYDQYGNITKFNDEDLTAQFTASIGNFYTRRYNKDGEFEYQIIRQWSVESGEFSSEGNLFDMAHYDFPPVWFASEVEGEAVLSASIPGDIVVEPLTILVAKAVPAKLSINVGTGDEIRYGTAYPGEFLLINAELKNDDGNINDESLIGVTVYISGTAEPIFESRIYSNEELKFQVPEDAEYDDIITVKVAFGEMTETVNLRIADLVLPLAKGWNLISTPYTLVNNHLYDIIDEDKIEIAWEYVHGNWLLVNADTVIKPLKAYYVKLKDKDTARFSAEKSPTAPPTRELKEGWNLVGQAYDVLNGENSLDLMEAFQNIADDALKFNIVVSPALNLWQESWIYTNNGSNNDKAAVKGYEIKAFSGYWVNMTEEGVLTGFSSTPIVHRNEL